MAKARAWGAVMAEGGGVVDARIYASDSARASAASVWSNRPGRTVLLFRRGASRKRGGSWLPEDAVFEGGGRQELFPQSAGQKRATRQAYEASLVTVAKGGKVAAPNAIPRNACRTTKAGVSCNVDGKMRRFQLAGGPLAGRRSAREMHAVVFTEGSDKVRRRVSGPVLFYADVTALSFGMKHWLRGAGSFEWADEFHLTTEGWTWGRSTFSGEGDGRSKHEARPNAKLHTQMVDAIVGDPSNEWSLEEQGRKAAPKRGSFANQYDTAGGEEKQPPGWLWAAVVLGDIDDWKVTARSRVLFFPTRRQAETLAEDRTTQGAKHGDMWTYHVMQFAGDGWVWRTSWTGLGRSGSKRPGGAELRKLEARMDTADSQPRMATQTPKKAAPKKAATKRPSGPSQPTLFGRSKARWGASSSSRALADVRKRSGLSGARLSAQHTASQWRWRVS